MKNKTYKILFILLILGITSCQNQIGKQAEFEKDPIKIIENLKSLGNFEDANINWSVMRFQKTEIDILKVELINGDELADDESFLKEIGKQAMEIVIYSISNEKEYDTFWVEFKQKGKNNSKNFERQYIYNLDEFKPQFY